MTGVYVEQRYVSLLLNLDFQLFGTQYSTKWLSIRLTGSTYR